MNKLWIAVLLCVTGVAFAQVRLGDLGPDAMVTTGAVDVVEADLIAMQAIADFAARRDNPHAVTAAQVGALTTEADTLATVIYRGGTTYSDVQFNGNLVQGQDSYANGISGIALGNRAISQGWSDFVWQGHVPPGGNQPSNYESHGTGTFNINPHGGVSGFWIGQTTLEALLESKATPTDITNIVDAAIEEMDVVEQDPKSIHKTGGTMTGLLMTAPAGLGLYGSGTTTNFIIRAEYDGTNVSFNVYEVER